MNLLMLTFVICALLTQVTKGNWFMKKCANKAGLCKKKCKPGEVYAKPAWVTCGKESVCCVPGKTRSGHPSVRVEKKTTRRSTAATRRSLMMNKTLMSSMTPVTRTAASRVSAAS
uniref:Beta-defensin n=1 Tax=Callithrix jacchus TaxID=9483 RepID=A0A8I4A286_CALJA